jgi:hypothetical protein
MTPGLRLTRFHSPIQPLGPAARHPFVYRVPQVPHKPSAAIPLAMPPSPSGRPSPLTSMLPKLDPHHFQFKPHPKSP